MNAPPEVLEILRQWVRKAENDLEAARRIMAVNDGCPWDTVCFHCPQAAEKYLKCLLTFVGVQAPRTHDLSKLLLLLPAEERPAVVPQDLAAMNPYAVEVRYADDWREPLRDDAMRALQLAENIRREARNRLPIGALP